jgi:hypothetical protein
MKALTIAIAGILAATAVVSQAKADFRIVLRDSYVIQAIKDAGFDVDTNSPMCDRVYGLTNLDVRKVVVCLNTHDNLAELMDTIRHEAIHVAQMCKGATIIDHMDVEEEAKILAKDLTDVQVVELLRSHC